MCILDNFTIKDIIEKIQKLIKKKYLRINEFIRFFIQWYNNQRPIFNFSFNKIYFSMKEINLRNISIKKKKMLWIKFADDIDTFKKQLI